MIDRISDLPLEERPREKLAQLGAAALDNAELLALFLRTGTKGRSAIRIGRDLLRHYGSIGSLGSAGVGELAKQPGLGLAKACQLVAAFELGTRAAREQIHQTALDSPELIHHFFAPQLAWLRQEKLLVALLDTRLRHAGTIEVSSGSLTETSAHPREILRPVITRGAYGFIIIHNHPSGDPSPSRQDQIFTRRMVEAADLLQLRFLDHLIIGRPDAGRSPYYSFRESGIIA
ncbi:MAG: JAB domain-containing protein [Verrucomicrobia bacterium]|nr:MAG: JAB domain-containing protein [Verrucomicrobiota bacterium]TAE86113.1 MAG: JAB domain-containing protein [Verrucomicrobiota bacterium]TAF23460.1 MAG: JAB domain-containing protein [Verrucomicrobiota bacterium]TAF40090.1 MAG: JAB domain-containing protein [Verrucomicrobiota bacterium]